MAVASDTLRYASLPFDEALAFYAAKTNIGTSKWSDLWESAHARAFSVAGATSDALLKDFRAAIGKALSEGTTLQEFRKDFDAIVAKNGWRHSGTPGFRAGIIYDTNLNMAFAAGRYAQMTEPATLKVFPYWTYKHSGARHPRLQHKAWNGLTLRADDGFWKTHYPPNGFRCGCWVEPQTAGDLRRAGREPDPSPKVDMIPAVLKDGTRVMTPRGVDPGFGYNVGEAWKQPVPGSPADASPAPPAPPIGGRRR